MSDTTFEELERKVLAWLAEHNRNTQVRAEQITATTNLLEEGILDSLAFIDLLAFLEQITGQSVDLSDLEPDEFSTARGLCSHMAQQAS